METKKTKFLVALILILSAVTFAQDEDQNSYVPVAIKSTDIYIQKYEELSLLELNTTINQYARDSATGRINEKYRMEIIENWNYYNAYFYRKTNQEIDKLIATTKYKFLKPLHIRDIEESKKEVVRFVIKSSISIATSSQYYKSSRQYYIHDRLLNKNYEKVESVEVLMILISQANLYMKLNTHEISQDQLDAYLLKKMPKKKVKKNGSGGAIWVVGGLFWAALTIIPNVIANA